MAEELITQSQLYTILIEDKRHKEDRRDQINNYYITLLVGIIGAIPIIERLSQEVLASNKGYIIRILLSILAAIGLAIALTWSYNLRRILFYLQILEQLIEKIEKSSGIYYITYITQQSELQNVPGRVTKYQLALPSIFIIIFLFTILYSLAWVLM